MCYLLFQQSEVNAIKWDPSGTLLASCSDDLSAKASAAANRPYTYTHDWTGTSIQWRLMEGISFEFEKIPLWNPHVEENLVVHNKDNRVFLSRNYRLIVAPRKFDVLKTNICPRSKASRANMLVLRTTIRPIVPRQKHSIVFIVHH